MGERIAGKQDGPILIIEGVPQIGKYVIFYTLGGGGGGPCMKIWLLNFLPIHKSDLWY